MLAILQRPCQGLVKLGQSLTRTRVQNVLHFVWNSSKIDRKLTECPLSIWLKNLTNSIYFVDFVRVKWFSKIHSSGWQPNNATIRTIDSLGQPIKIKGIHGVCYLMVMGIPNKGRIVDHQSRVSEFPVVPLVRHSDQTAQGRLPMSEPPKNGGSSRQYPTNSIS